MAIGSLLAAGLVLGAMFWVVGDHHFAGVDRRAFALLAADPHGVLARNATAVAVIAPMLVAVVVIAGAALLIRRRAWLDLGVLGGGFLLCVVAARYAKLVERRPRPSGALLHAGGYSFPSTDAALAVGLLAVAIAVARQSPVRTQRAAAIADGCLSPLAAGLLLVALRAHYLSDVIAGWALGVAAFTTPCIAAVAARRHSAKLMASGARPAPHEPAWRRRRVVAGCALAVVAVGVLVIILVSRQSTERRFVSCLRRHGWRAIDAPTKLFDLQREHPTFEGVQVFLGDMLVGLIDSGSATPQTAVVLIGGRLAAPMDYPVNFAPFIKDAQLHPLDFAAVLVSATDNSSGRIACEHVIDPGLSSFDEF